MDDLRRVRSSTTDPEEADALLREAQGRFAFSRDPGADFSFRVEQAGDDGLTVGVYRIGGEWVSDGEFDQFSVSGVFAGDYRWEMDGERDSSYGVPFLARPGHELFGHGESLSIVNVYIAPERLREVARVVYADDSIVPVFGSPRPVDLRRGRHMLQLVQVAAEFVNSGTIDDPMVRAGLSHALAVGVLECFPLTGERRARPATARSELSIHRRATRFVDDYLSLPISVGDMAAAAGASQYDLDAAFRSRTGASAVSYLRAARLAAAHADRAREPALGDDALAARWGFASTDRFRRAYDSAYGAVGDAAVESL
ncbi:helix-turn-helix domain-containing protein [Leifsonia shinshuensis]|uniref:helix-turn-helix domain-containing protein n=1 Tax=Leifsonia shinshuensis TaxID=150026 RepID=UPI001F50B8E6|nr:helix-turn-helix domain-containing protein [Leifsonia shinshuensis]MCI0159359.1 helix-turn-helix domain-containing protein [Leifsonia shinshuensis]